MFGIAFNITTSYGVKSLNRYPVLFVRLGRCNKLQQRCVANQHDTKTSVRSLRESHKTTKERGYLLLLIPIITFYLGTWQVRRRKWKLQLIEKLKERTMALPVPFPSDLSELEDMEYRKVIVRGKFDHSKELYVMPRSLLPGTDPSQDDSSSSSRKFNRPPPKSGAYVITAFELSSHQHPNLRILVNRGWVPRNRMKPETRQEAQIEDEVELVGVVRHQEQRMPFAANNRPASNQWFHRDIDAMCHQLNTDAVFIDADRNSTVAGGPVGGQTNVTVRNEHLSYIITWYSLSAATLFMWWRMYWR